MPANNEPAGLFETLAVIDGRARFVERHLARLLEGCRRLRIPAPPHSQLSASISEQAALPGTGVVKLIVMPGADAADTPLWSVSAEPPRRRPAEWSRDGVRIISCATRLPMRPELAGLKLLDRDAQVLARREWTTESIAEGLMLDGDGRLISGTMTNVYAVIDGAVCTPAIVRCGVAGVMRATLLEVWQAAGQRAVVRDLEPRELDFASEIFLSNALIGVWPVRALDGREFAAGPVANAAAAWVQRIVTDQQACACKSGWVAVSRAAIPGYDETFARKDRQKSGTLDRATTIQAPKGNRRDE
jgi:4-amino-4-deoxychorismate lyase